MSADIFHKATQNSGGRLDTTTLPNFEVIRKMAEQSIASARATFPKLPPIHFDFAASDTPNAFAAKHDGQYIIGMTKGIVIGIARLFQRMLSDRRILTHIGDPASDTEHPYLVMPPMSPAPILSALQDDYVANGSVQPSNKTRINYSSMLIQLALRFVLLHELAHIVNGHVDWKKPTDKSAIRLEFGILPKNEDEAAEMQMLEVDADDWATLMGLSLISYAELKFYEMPELQGYNNRLFAWLFAQFSFMKLFPDLPPSELLKSSHPPFRFRVGYALRSAIAAAQSHGKQFEELTNTIVGAATAIEQAFHSLTGKPVPPSQDWYTEAFTTDGISHWNRIVDCWTKRLRQELLSHCYGPLNGESFFHRWEKAGAAIPAHLAE